MSRNGDLTITTADASLSRLEVTLVSADANGVNWSTVIK